MKRSRLITIGAVAAFAAAVTAAVTYLARGDRFRVYADADAARCWAALEHLTPPSSTLQPRGVDVAAGGDGSTEVAIRYRMDRVLAGLDREIRCVYPDTGEGAGSIVLNGSPLDAATLDDVNRALR